MKLKKFAIVTSMAALILSAGAFAACSESHEHTYSTAWNNDATSHWHVADCGHEETTEKLAHTFDGGKVTKEATHTEEGVKTYTCTECGREKTESIPAKSEEHTYYAEWTNDETDHWHAAKCGHDVKEGKVAHSWEDRYDGENKAWNEVCTVCDYVKTNSTVAAGSDAEHYLPISTAEDFKSITSGEAGAVKYYKLTNDLTLTAEYTAKGEFDSWGEAYHDKNTDYIVLDGDGYKIHALYNAWLFDHLGNSTVKNLDVETQTNLITDAANITIENVDVYGEIFWSGGNRAVYAIYVMKGITIKNCTNYTVINCTGDDKSYNALFVGYPISDGAYGPQTLTFENCKNAGELSSGRAAMFVANGAHCNKCTELKIVNCGNIDGGLVRGTIEKPNGKIDPFCAISETKLGTITVDGVEKQVTDYDAVGSGFVNGPEDAMTLTKNADGTFTFNKSEKENVAYYVVSVGLYTHWELNGMTGTNRVYATERIDATDAQSYTTALKNLSFVDDEWVTNNPTATETTVAGNRAYVLDGKTYYLITTEGCDVGGKAKAASIFAVSAYSADGKLISSVGL